MWREKLPEKEGIRQECNEYGRGYYVCPYCSARVKGIEQHITVKHPEKRKRCPKCKHILR